MRYNEQFLTKIQYALEARLLQLRSEVDRTLFESQYEGANEAGFAVRDLGEEAVEDAAEELVSALTEHQLYETNEINHALARIKDGTYGICAGCGENIDVPRLESYPSAIRCVNCQEKYEKLAH